MPMLPPNEFAESLRAIMSNMVHRSDAITAAASSSVVVRGGAATAAPTTSLQDTNDLSLAPPSGRIGMGT